MCLGVPGKIIDIHGSMATVDFWGVRRQGFATAVYPTETFDDDVFALAKRLAGGPTEALGIAKNLINDAALMDRLDYHLDRELDHLARIADGDNFAEGIAAFFEKRAPEFGVK